MGWEGKLDCWGTPDGSTRYHIAMGGDDSCEWWEGSSVSPQTRRMPWVDKLMPDSGLTLGIEKLKEDVRSVTAYSNNDLPGEKDGRECGWSVDGDEVEAVVDRAVEDVGGVMQRRGHERSGWGHERNDDWLDGEHMTCKVQLASSIGLWWLGKRQMNRPAPSNGGRWGRSM